MSIINSILVTVAVELLVALPALGVAGVSSRKAIVITVFLSSIFIFGISWWLGVPEVFLNFI